MGPGGMSPEAGALTRGVTEGVPLPPLLLPHPGHVISQSLNRPACEMGMTIAVTQASRPTTVRPAATAPGVRHCTRGCPHTDLCHPHLCPVGNCPQDAGSLASLWEAAPGHPQPTQRRHGRQPHGSGERQAPRQHPEAPCPRLAVSRARLDSWGPSGPPFPRRDAGGETPLAASGRPRRLTRAGATGILRWQCRPGPGGHTHSSTHTARPGQWVRAQLGSIKAGP